MGLHELRLPLIEAALLEAGLPPLEDWQRDKLTKLLNLPIEGRLQRAVRESCRQMPWLTAADDGAKQMALSYAEAIDTAAKGDPEQLTKALYLGPHLLAALSALGGTPAARQTPLGSDKAGPRGVLDELKQKRQTRTAG